MNIGKVALLRILLNLIYICADNSREKRFMLRGVNKGCKGNNGTNASSINFVTLKHIVNVHHSHCRI